MYDDAPGILSFAIKTNTLFANYRPRGLYRAKRYYYNYLNELAVKNYIMIRTLIILMFRSFEMQIPQSNLYFHLLLVHHLMNP